MFELIILLFITLASHQVIADPITGTVVASTMRTSSTNGLNASPTTTPITTTVALTSITTTNPTTTTPTTTTAALTSITTTNPTTTTPTTTTAALTSITTTNPTTTILPVNIQVALAVNIDPCVSIYCDNGQICVYDAKVNNVYCALSKAGTCPIIAERTPYEYSLIKCQVDFDCPRDQKCCTDGRISMCKQPCDDEFTCKCTYGVKFFVENNCRKCACKTNPCLDKNPCTGNYYCVFNQVTLEAECRPKMKPGSCADYGIINCPANVTIYSSCSNDYNCTGDQKCCNNPCANECIEPCITDISKCKCDVGVAYLQLVTDRGLEKEGCRRCACYNPCESSKCDDGYSCVLTKNSTCELCLPVAECVQNRCDFGMEIPNFSCANNGARCPSGYKCEIGKRNAYAVCCPQNDPCRNKCRRDERCVVKSDQTTTVCLPSCDDTECTDGKACANGIGYDKNGCSTCECLL